MNFEKKSEVTNDTTLFNPDLIFKIIIKEFERIRDRPRLNSLTLNGTKAFFEMRDAASCISPFICFGLLGGRGKKYL